jgi:hypothetical protein
MEPILPLMCFPTDILFELEKKQINLNEIGLSSNLQLAWASANHCLLIWSIKKRNYYVLEYNGNENKILNCGLICPKSGFFSSQIFYILVTSTVSEVFLLALCQRPDLSSFKKEVLNQKRWELRAIPEFSTLTKGIIIRCVEGTSTGRIILGGDDGQLYEFCYTDNRRCFLSIIANRKLIFPSIFTNFCDSYFYSQAPIIQILVDNNRKIVYLKTEDSCLQIYKIGENEITSLNFITRARETTIESNSSKKSKNNKYQTGNKKRKMLKIVRLFYCKVEESNGHMIAIMNDGSRCLFTLEKDENLRFTHQKSNNFRILGFQTSLKRQHASLSRKMNSSTLRFMNRKAKINNYATSFYTTRKPYFIIGDNYNHTKLFVDNREERFQFLIAQKISNIEKKKT